MYYRWFYWFTIILHGLSAWVIFVVFVYYIAQYCCSGSKTQNIKWLIKLLTVVGSLACVFCAISDAATVYFDTEKGKNDFNDVWYDTQAISHAINNLMTYMIYIYRLHLSFKDTIYRLSMLQYSVLLTFIVLDLGDFLGDFMAYIYGRGELLIYLDIFGLFTELSITVMCLWLFNKNLFSLMLKMKTSIAIFDYDRPYNSSPYSQSFGLAKTGDQHYHNSPISHHQPPLSPRIVNEKIDRKSDSLLLNARQKRLIDRIVRNALLCSLTMFFWILERIAWFTFIFHPKHINTNWMFFAKCLTAIALVIDAVCMLFTFKFATLLYRSFCITCDMSCHACCGKLSLYFADRHETL